MPIQPTFTCATCDAEIAHHPVFHLGLAFCCAGCAADGPCMCSYDLPVEAAVAPMDLAVVEVPHVAVQVVRPMAAPVVPHAITHVPPERRIPSLAGTRG